MLETSSLSASNSKEHWNEHIVTRQLLEKLEKIQTGNGSLLIKFLFLQLIIPFNRHPQDTLRRPYKEIASPLKWTPIYSPNHTFL